MTASVVPRKLILRVYFIVILQIESNNQIIALIKLFQMFFNYVPPAHLIP